VTTRALLRTGIRCSSDSGVFIENQPRAHPLRSF
jgi:hypothetical protein